MGAELRVVTAHESDATEVVEIGNDKWFIHESEKAEKVARDVATELGAEGLRTSFTAVLGKPQDALVAEAERVNARLIVVGNVGMQGWAGCSAAWPVRSRTRRPATCTSPRPLSWRRDVNELQVAGRAQVPPFQVMNILDRVAQMRAAGRDVISLCAGEPSGGAPRAVSEQAAGSMPPAWR